MSVAHDIYAETNPAFCSYVLVAFAAGYLCLNEEGPEIPIVYLALPIALSADLGDSFKGTNKKTGLLEWYERSPEIQINLAERLNASMDLVTDAIRFACFARILRLDNGARLRLGGQAVKKSLSKLLGEDSRRVVNNAERLGYWFAAAGSTRAAFSVMGITV